ncbi:ATP-binding protein [Sphingomonas naphthae]|uniref:histidine kinase n=1 Tax=Sphingomonas naphthae TaxID=1813468 RepID=A0ABY7THW2_9SPHN|nr:ATP-binding protein [Sphingomonas naphthae]WCT72770.1 ATP-binding protein [Sphingomonas naphthae]
MDSDIQEAPDTGWRALPRLAIAALGACAVAALLVALLVLTAAVNRKRDEAIARERHSYEIIVLTASLEGSLARSEAALGRFVIDGDRRTGTTYNDEWVRAGRQIRRLGLLMGGDPARNATVTELQALYEKRAEETSPAAINATYRRGWQALSFYAKAGQTDTLPQFARILKRIGAEQREVLGARSDYASLSTERAQRLSRFLSVLGVGLVLAAIGLGWLALRSFAGRRVAQIAARAEADRAELLENRVAARTAELKAANASLEAEIEERRNAEAQAAEAELALRQAQKMDAVGQLTGGIAHDFNNMLSVVVGGLDLARRRIAAEADEVTRHIDNALEGANRAAALTRRLLTFARAEALSPQGVDPADLVAGMVDLIDRTIGERISVAIERATDAWPVWVDAYQLENAILNLAVNARDAMDGAGRLTIAVSNHALRRGPGRDLPPGDYVRIAVIDEGTGMEPAVLERVFEPFFTTKPVGKGTGLGLSQIFGFAQQSGGTVEIQSIVGEGTTVSLWLPRFAGEAGVTPIAPALSDAPSDGGRAQGQAILVLEDDPRVRASTIAALAELGYLPLPAATAEEAMAILDDGQHVDLILTDVMMPATTGPEFVRQAAQRHGHVPALFVTGYAGGEGDALVGHDVLRKPFTLNALAAAVQAALHPDRPSKAA